MTKPVVLIAEELSPATLDALGPDFEVRHVDGADRSALLPALADVDAVLIRSAYPEVAVLVLSQYVEERYASELIASRREGLGYLLKDRVADVDQFLESVQTVGQGGTVLDQEVLTQILVRSRQREDLQLLSPREREVLGLMAQGLSNASIATNLYLTESAVEKHIGSIFMKLGVTSATGNRRVLAVLKYLGYPDHSL